MVKIYYTPLNGANTGKTLFSEALSIIAASRADEHRQPHSPDYSGITCLVPHRSGVAEAQRVFHGLITTVAQGCYIPPEVSTISQFSKGIFALSRGGRVMQPAMVPVVMAWLSGKGIGYSSLVADLIRDIKRCYPHQDSRRVKITFLDVFQELNIPDSMAELVTNCLDLYRRYEAFLAERNLVDEEDMLRESVQFIPQRPVNVAIINGFSDPDPLELHVMKSLIQHSEHALVAIPYDSQFRQVIAGFAAFLREGFDVEEHDISVSTASARNTLPNYSAYPDTEGEVEGIARNIKSLFVSGRCRALENIAVTFPQLEPYTPIISRVFKRYGIPYDLSVKKPIGKARPFLDLLCLLNAAAEDYPRLLFAQAISSPFFKRISEPVKHWLPLLSLRSGIVSGKEAWLNLIAVGSETIDRSAVPLDNVREDITRIFEILRPLSDTASGVPVGFHINALRKIVQELGFLEGPHDASGDRPFIEEYSEEKRGFNAVLDQIAILEELFPAQATLKEFIEIISHFLGSTFIEKEGRGVRVMDFSEGAGLPVQHLFFGGLTDGGMPARQEMDYFLPDSIKKRLGFPHLEKYLDMQRYFFNGIIASSQHVHLSYPLMDGEEMHLPSSFLYPATEMKEQIPGIFSPEEYFVREGDIPLAAHLREMVLDPSPFSHHASYKVTDIDAYRFCPRRFYIERVADVLPLSVKEYEVEAVTLGSILHKIMEKIIPEPMDDFEKLKERAREIAEEVAGEKRIDGYWKDLIRDTFAEILPDIYRRELEIRRGGYVSSVLEKTLTGEPLPGVRLKGKIDRFDSRGHSIQILDYKSGAALLTCSRALEGKENLQLFLYAAIMKSHGYVVDRVGIYSLKDIKVKWCPSAAKRGSKKEKGMDDYIALSLMFLEDTVKGMRRGCFTAAPLNEYNCWNCHEYALCPYIQR